MDRRIVVVAGVAAVLALVILGAFLFFPFVGRQESGISVAPQLATLAAGAGNLVAPPTPAAAPTLTLPEAGPRAVLAEEPARQGAAEIKVNATIAWSLTDGGLEGPIVEARARVPERQLDFTVRLKRNSDAYLPATHVLEVTVVGSPGQPPPVRALIRLGMKNGEDAPPQSFIGPTEKIVDGVFWVALSADPKFSPKNMEAIALPWVDILVEYSNGRRAVLSFEKGPQGARVMERAIATWNSIATR